MARYRAAGDERRRRRTDGATFARIAPGAPFLTQLLAGTSARPAPEEAAGAAYGAAAAAAQRRLPPGYRMTRET